MKPTPHIPTHAERVKAATDSIRAYQVEAYKRLVAVHQDGMRLFWRPAHGVTPAEIAEELGTDAAMVFVRSAAVKACVEAFDEQDATGIPPTWSAEFHEDGRVTLTPVE